MRSRERIRPVMNLINHSIAALLPTMPKRLVWIFSRKYIAGTTLEDAERVARSLNDDGCLTTIDLLGEFVSELGQAVGYCDQYLSIVRHMEAAGIRGNYSLKPTMFGMCIDERACFEMVRRVVLLPAPFEPMMVTKSASPTSSEMPRTAAIGP